MLTLCMKSYMIIIACMNSILSLLAGKDGWAFQFAVGKQRTVAGCTYSNA